MTDDQIDILVCMRVTGPLMLADNATGKCAECQSTIQYRPHAPPKARKICMECAAHLIEPDDVVTTTPQMLADLKAYIDRKKQ